MLIRRFLGRPIAFHRVLADVTGSALDALFLSQCIYWNDVIEGESERAGWFYKTAEEWGSETGMSRTEIETARRSLKAKGVLEEKKEGVPCRLFYRVNWEALQTSLRETCKLEEPKVANKAAENLQTPIKTEITSKTTTEITPLLFPPETKQKAKGTQDEIRAYCQELSLPQSDADWFYDKCEGNGWKNGTHKILDWKATIRSWKTAQYLPSQKLNGTHYARPSAHQQPRLGDLNHGRTLRRPSSP